jgi:hypothetical protein
MILNLFACFFLAFINPADPSGTTMYPGGISDEGKRIFGAPESTKLPILTLCFNIKDKNEKIVPAGFYKVSISQDGNYILFFQNNYIAGVFKVRNVKDLNADVPINSAVVKKYTADSVLITVRQDKKQVDTTADIVWRQ